MKNLHIVLDKDTHHNFMVKAREQNTTASDLVRKWIKKFLSGELT